MNKKTLNRIRSTAAQPIHWLSEIFNVAGELSTRLADIIDVPDEKNDAILEREAYHEAGHAVLRAVYRVLHLRYTFLSSQRSVLQPMSPTRLLRKAARTNKFICMKFLFIMEDYWQKKKSLEIISLG